jgi:hypothetical protein
MVNIARPLISWVIYASAALGPCAVARTVDKLQINAVGLTIESKERNTDQLCKDFRPTLKQVRNYFNKAYHVDGYTITTERYSPCAAIGTLTYSDGSFGEWTLYSGGTSSFTFNRGNQVYLFYKNYKWNDPTACSYGLGSELEC